MLIQRNQPENSYESIDPVEDAKLLGDPKTGKASLIKTEEVEHDMVNKKEDTKVCNNAKLLKKTEMYKVIKEVLFHCLSQCGLAIIDQKKDKTNYYEVFRLSLHFFWRKKC